MSGEEEIIDIEEFTRRRMMENRLARQSRQSFMWLKRLKRFLRLGLVVFLLFALYYSLRFSYWYMRPDAFDSVSNQSLMIVNNKIVPSVNILRALRQHQVPSLPIYLYDPDILKEDILKLEPVEDVFIRRYWLPARLVVIIKERRPIITVYPDIESNPVAFFAKGGKLIGRDYLPLDQSFETFKVLSYGVRGDDYRNWTPDKVASIEKMANTIEAYSKQKIEYIDFRNPSDVYVKLPDVNIRIGEMDDTVFTRIKRIPSILPQIINLDKKIKYLDLRWGNVNYIKLED